MAYTSNMDEDFEEAIRGRSKVANYSSVGNPSKHDDLDILNIFNTPEYRARQISKRQNEGIKNSYGTVSNINVQAIKKRKGKKLSTFKKGVITITVIGFLSIIAITSSFTNNPKSEQETSIPTGYVQLIATEQVEYGDSVYSIASEYYDADTYGTIYKDINDFVKDIVAENHLPADGKITTYDTISLPVLVSIDNSCYQELKKLEEQIKKIKTEAYWVDYTVKLGDSLSSIAASASGSYGETISLVNEIMSKNNLSNSMIFEGQKLQIVNPALGKLKISFNEMQEAMFESLKSEETQK